MSNNSSLSQIGAVATTRTPADHRVIAFWRGSRAVVFDQNKVLHIDVSGHATSAPQPLTMST